MMLIKKAERTQLKARIGLFGASGSGKTYSALLLASGLVPWDKVCVIDTEHQSSHLYAHLGDFSVIELSPPFTPERYIRAIKMAEDAGFEAIVVDSISHEWIGEGGILEIVDNSSGKSKFTSGWKDATPRHNAFINKIIYSSAHVICCGRTKQEYEIVENERGQKVPQKMGLKATTRDGFDYEMQVCFDIDMKHFAASSKDRSSMYIDEPPFVISKETGLELLGWLNSGKEAPPSEVTKEMEDIRRGLANIYNQSQLTPAKFEEITGVATEDVRDLSVADLRVVEEKLTTWLSEKINKELPKAEKEAA